VRRCPECGEQVESTFRFCPWCAAPQRRKLTDFFRPHPEIRGELGRALRVSRYLATDALRHVRFSIWSGDPEASRVDAAVSLDEAEAARLAEFLTLDADAERSYGEDTQPSICG
jgi:zinc-ribbon domain